MAKFSVIKTIEFHFVIEAENEIAAEQKIENDFYQGKLDYAIADKEFSAFASAYLISEYD